MKVIAERDFKKGLNPHKATAINGEREFEERDISGEKIKCERSIKETCQNFLFLVFKGAELNWRTRIKAHSRYTFNIQNHTKFRKNSRMH